MDGATWALIKATDTLSPIGWYLTSLTWPTVKYLQKIDWFYFLWMDIIIITSIIPHIITPMTTSTPIHARAWKEKALAGYNSQQIPTNDGLREVSRTFAIRHSPFNGKWQKFDIRCVKLSCHSNSVVHFLKGEGSWWIFLGGQRYFVRNGSNSRWNVSYVDGICQAASSDILERSCSSFGRGKVMISFLGRARPFCAYKKLFDMDCSLWSRNKSPFIAGHSQ